MTLVIETDDSALDFGGPSRYRVRCSKTGAASLWQYEKPEVPQRTNSAEDRGAGNVTALVPKRADA